MLKVLTPAAMVLALAVGSSAAMAAPQPTTTHPAQKTAPTHMKTSKAKEKACGHEWTAQKKHTQTRKAFMAKCEARA